ncbi:ATP adenylyltransferase-domain-containing protein [Dimargaris cristalligena]|uniref:ATP adenylyltransferase-domain-containing protein n=1 Tax=Dimargaris cristalligena TaxID=215637 RepID=A0A4P9ZS62_9FUNG|nr:ATP adenylyltransferase-domain-containing protein [Dimargaris cristalligena]|eukprot:RKP36374.1 ATP adenylyltransferase-domain-containing protein [Dimargaris cristalligena]
MSQTALSTLVRTCFDRARASGALLFTPTSLHIERAAGINFEIRLVSALASKPVKPVNKDSGAVPPKVNPFLPYDPELYVTSHDSFHILLNKYCVSPHHLLIVTKAAVQHWEFDQNSSAPWTGVEYLHRSYQVLLELVAEDYQTHHQQQGQEAESSITPDQIGQDATNGVFSYSFFCSSDMMMIIPRRNEKCGITSINSLGFAGMILAKSQDELQTMKQVGVLGILEHVGFPLKG